jgi:hypothetical protein
MLNIALYYTFSKKLSTNIAFSSAHERNSGDLLTYNEDFKTGLYNIFVQDQSSKLVRDTWQQSINTYFSWQLSQNNSLKIGLSTQWQLIDNHLNNYTADSNQHFLYLLPSIELRLNRISFSYGKIIFQPSINDLRPIAITYSPLFTFVGNPNLKPTSVHRWGINYFNYNLENQLSLNLSSNISIESNTIIRKRTVSTEGAEVSTPVNRNGKFIINLNVFAGKTFNKQNKWRINTTAGTNLVANHNFFNVNNDNGYQNTMAIIVTEEFNANWNDVFEIRSAYNINYAITRYQFIKLKPTAYNMQKASLSVDIFLPRKYTWNINNAYSFNPLVAAGFRQSSNW